jgi:hypothetical protein
MLLHHPPLPPYRRRPPRHRPPTLHTNFPIRRRQHPGLRILIRRLIQRRLGILRIATKQLHNLLHAQLAHSAVLAALNGLVGELALLLLQLEDALFDRVGDGDFVDYDVDFLGEAVDAVDGLFFDELWGEGVSVCLLWG